MRWVRVAVCLACLGLGCRRPRDGLIAAGAGGGIAIGGIALGGYMDRDQRAPDTGFAIGMGSFAVGGTMIVVGLVSALVLQLRDSSLLSGTVRTARGLGDEALEAARTGNCPLALQLADDVRAIDTDYHDRVLAVDADLVACRRR